MSISFGLKLTGTNGYGGAMVSAANGDTYGDPMRALFRMFQTLIQANVITIQNAPPGLPGNEATYIVGPAPSGAWLTFANAIAFWTIDDPLVPGGKWEFWTPQAGWVVYNQAAGAFYVFNGVAWVVTTSSPSRYDIVGQSSAISGASLVSAAVAGQYGISWSAVVQVPDAGSPPGAVLGGTTGFQVTYTDVDTNAVVTTPTWWGGDNNGSAPTSAGANIVGTQVSGEIVVNAKAGTPITISFGYGPAAGMQFALHAKANFLG